MNAVVILSAVFSQWNMGPQEPPAWDTSPQVAAVTKWDTSPLVPQPPLATGEAAPTPYSEVVRVIGLLPKPAIGFVDYGCGADARWCVVAAEKGWRATGIELDPARARAAREHVRRLGFGHLITIIEGDATQVDVQADVGVAYLYADTLEALRPRLERLRAFASYMHRPPGLPVVRNGDSWVYQRPTQQAVVTLPQQAVYGGRIYTGPCCNDPRCQMRQSIMGQLSQTPKAVATVQPSPTPVTAKANTGQCCCGGDVQKFCFCKDHGMQCKCTPTTGSVWHLNGEWSADRKVAPPEPMWIPPKSQQAQQSTQPAAPKQSWVPGTRFQWLTDGQWRDTPQPGMNYPTVGVYAQRTDQMQPVASPVRVQSSCPGGRCHTYRKAG